MECSYCGCERGHLHKGWCLTVIDGAKDDWVKTNTGKDDK